MTTTHRERYRAPLHRQASTLICLLASTLFHASIKHGDQTPDGERIFEVWFRVKQMGEQVDSGTPLDSERRAELTAALELAHSTQHDPIPAACNCIVAQRINALNAILETQDCALIS